MVLTLASPTPSPSPRLSFTTRLSTAVISSTTTVAQQLPSNYISLVRSIVGGPRIELPEAEEADTTPTPSMDLFENTSPSNGSGSGTPPPNYTTVPPTPQPSFSQPTQIAASRHPCPAPSLLLTRPTSLTEVVDSPAPCTSCTHLQLQLHLVSLQNEAYLAQRDYLLRHQPLPPRLSASSGVLSFLIATAIRGAFLVAFLLWPHVRHLLGRVREWERQWEVGGRVWSVVGLVWGAVLSAGKKNGFGRSKSGGGEATGWEVVLMKWVEEVVRGVGEGVREGLGVWGVKVEM